MTDDTQKQVAETVADWSDLPDVYVTKVERPNRVVWNVVACSVPMAIGPEVRLVPAYKMEALAARLAAVEADRAGWIAREAVAGADAIAARKAASDNFDRAEAAEARNTELEALLAAYQDQTVPDLTAVYIAGGMDRRDEVARLSDFLSDFASAKIDALRYSPPYGSSPEDEPDPVVDAETVWAWQADAKTALAPQPTATKETKSV